MLKSQKPHIGIFGKTNVGKSSFINAVCKQDITIVSEIAGTTTDAVSKHIELADAGPVVLIDTAGLDDVSELGEKRVKASEKVLKQIDLAIIVIDQNAFNQTEEKIIVTLQKSNTPFIFVHNKHDQIELAHDFKTHLELKYKCEVIPFSAKTSFGLEEVITAIKNHLPNSAFNNPTVLGDLVKTGDIVLLVTPVDIEAPKGRLILPQVQTIRDALDHDCIAVVVKERELDAAFRAGIKPRLVVTDSQAFLKVDASVPKDIPLTSFSILFARLKGDFYKYVEGTRAIGKLKDGDRVLILESCSHHVTGDDIGRVKIPRWLENFTGKRLHYEVVSGLDDYQDTITNYSLVIQCGGCMLTRKQVLNRLAPAITNNIPVTNYGMTIAYCHGIFERAIKPFDLETSENLL